MTNDEYLMTKEMGLTKIRPKNEVNHPFELRHSFGIRHLSFVIFSVARFVLVLLVMLSLSCSAKRITKANVDQVADGMSKKQVESILGPPTSLRTEVTTKMTTYVYRQGKDTVTVLFKDDKVQSKDSTLSD
ncbi:MAG: outer membrane protein assembly factor BamE [Candidatus Udaeobacter sp.]